MASSRPSLRSLSLLQVPLYPLDVRLPRDPQHLHLLPRPAFSSHAYSDGRGYGYGDRAAVTAGRTAQDDRRAGEGVEEDDRGRRGSLCLQVRLLSREDTLEDRIDVYYLSLCVCKSGWRWSGRGFIEVKIGTDKWIR